MSLPAISIPADSAAAASAPRLAIASDLLGRLDVAMDDLIDFPEGLFGFPDCRAFVLVPGAREGIYWLQSVEHAPLAFLLVDPFQFVSGYSVDLPPAELMRLGTVHPAEIAVLCIVTLPPRRGEHATANLQGPILLNMRLRRGHQAVFPECGYGMREKVRLLG